MEKLFSSQHFFSFRFYRPARRKLCDNRIRFIYNLTWRSQVLNAHRIVHCTKGHKSSMAHCLGFYWALVACVHRQTIITITTRTTLTEWEKMAKEKERLQRCMLYYQAPRLKIQWHLILLLVEFHADAFFFISFYFMSERKNDITKWNVGENNNWIIIFEVIYLPIAFIFTSVYFSPDPFHCRTLFFRSIYAYLQHWVVQFFVRWHPRLCVPNSVKVVCLFGVLLLSLMMVVDGTVCTFGTLTSRWLHPRNIFSKHGPFNLSIPLCSKYFNSL